MSDGAAQVAAGNASSRRRRTRPERRPRRSRRPRPPAQQDLIAAAHRGRRDPGRRSTQVTRGARRPRREGRSPATSRSRPSSARSTSSPPERTRSRRGARRWRPAPQPGRRGRVAAGVRRVHRRDRCSAAARRAHARCTTAPTQLRDGLNDGRGADPGQLPRPAEEAGVHDRRPGEPQERLDHLRRHLRRRTRAVLRRTRRLDRHLRAVPHRQAGVAPGDHRAALADQDHARRAG